VSTHSVEKHLVVSPAEYDVEIRRFVPRYDAMLDEAAGALADHLSKTKSSRILDLGAGTGALSEKLAARFSTAHMILLDADSEMLSRAEARLAEHRARIELIRGSFTDALPSCDAAVASLALHHLHSPAAKQEVYANIRRALAPGGVFVNADAQIPASTALSAPIVKRWAGHLVDNGDTEAQAYERFAQWATEDRYLGIDEELDMLRTAGFSAVDVRYRFGPTAVIVALP
jgi:tRNA (cmo5U34)-methyltransferase